MQNYCLITPRINYCVCEFSIGKLHTNGVKSSHCATAVDALRKKIPRRIVESHHALWAGTVGGRRAREREEVNSGGAAAAVATAVRWVVCQALWRFQVQSQGCMRRSCQLLLPAAAVVASPVCPWLRQLPPLSTRNGL